MLSREQVERLIRCAKMGDYISYRENPELAVLMTLMFYAPMKLVDAQRITIENLQSGTYVSKKRGEVHFTLPEEQMKYLSFYIHAARIRNGEPLLSNTKRAFDKIFRKIAETEGIEARLSDVYYLGEKENR